MLLKKDNIVFLWKMVCKVASGALLNDIAMKIYGKKIWNEEEADLKSNYSADLCCEQKIQLYYARYTILDWSVDQLAKKCRMY